MADINAKVNEAYVSTVIERLDEAFTKMDEARIWARRQAMFFGGGVLAAVTASDSESWLAGILWVVMAVCLVAAVGLELGKYADADAAAANLYNEAMDMVEFVGDDTEEQDGINL